MEKSPTPISTEEMSSKRKISIEVPIVNSKAEDETKADKKEILNGKPKEKIIKLPELTNMDPLEYFSRFLDIPEMILKHFSSKDVLATSEVSPSWFNFIALSKVLMEKIQIVFDRDFVANDENLVGIQNKFYPSYHNFTTSSENFSKTKIVFKDKSTTQSEDFNRLKNSSRLYQCIEIKRWKVNVEDGNGNLRRVGDFVTDSELDFFYSKTHEWKNVSLENVYFRKKLDLWRFLSAIESSVERISVDHFALLPFEDPSSEIESFEALKFPKLKQFKICLLGFHTDTVGSFDNNLVRCLLNSIAIEELTLVDCYGKEILTKMLTNFDKLKSLVIVSKYINEVFEDESWKKFQFKLKSLTIANVIRYSWNCDHVTNFLNFLKSQSGYLEILLIRAKGEDRVTIFDLILKMPKLKNLTLVGFGEFLENGVKKKISTSITDLRLFQRDNANLKYLLDSMPKVRNLSLKSIDEEDFKMLKSLKRKFEKLTVRFLKGVALEELEEIMTENYTSLEIAKPSGTHDLQKTIYNY